MVFLTYSATFDAEPDFPVIDERLRASGIIVEYYVADGGLSYTAGREHDRPWTESEPLVRHDVRLTGDGDRTRASLSAHILLERDEPHARERAPILREEAERVFEPSIDDLATRLAWPAPNEGAWSECFVPDGATRRCD